MLKNISQNKFKYPFFQKNVFVELFLIHQDKVNAT